MHTVLLQEKPLTKEDHVMIRTSLPVKGQVENMFHGPTSAMAQTPTLTKWQPICSKGACCPLSLELQVLLGPVEYVDLTNTLAPILWWPLWPVERDWGKFLLIPGILIYLVWHSIHMDCRSYSA